MFVRLRKCARMGCSSASHLYLQSARETHIFNSTKIVMDFVFICSYSSFYPPSFLLISFYTSLACFLYVSRSFLLSTSSVSLTLVAFVCLSFLLSISLSLCLRPHFIFLPLSLIFLIFAPGLTSPSLDLVLLPDYFLSGQ